MNPFEAWIFACLLNALWQIPLLFAAAWIAARLARRLGPQMEHRAWVGALFLQSVLPFCRLSLNDLWLLAQRFAFWDSADSPGHGAVRVILGPGTVGVSRLLHLPAALITALTLLYAVCLLYAASRLAWGLWRTEAMRRQAQPIDLAADARIRLERIRRWFGLVYAIDIADSSVISGPLSVGIGRPALLLPAGFLDRVSGEDLDTVFAHELAHMRRRDFALNLLYGVIALPFAWHPLLRLTRAHIAETRELACDAMAADAVHGSENYARSLLRLASMLPDRAAPGILHAIGIFDANIFERRIMNLMRNRPETRGLRRLAVVVACGLIAFTAGASALALRLDAGADSQPPKNPTKIHVRADALKIVSQIEPVYPPEAKKNNNTIDGAVLLNVDIGKDGAPESIVVAKSLRDDYDKSAIDAVRQWRWEPFLLNGDPIVVATTITVQYSTEP